MDAFNVILLVIWIACGIIAYGRAKACWFNFLSKRKFKFKEEHELACILLGFFGVIGLIFILAVCPPSQNEFKFCFKTPKQ